MQFNGEGRRGLDTRRGRMRIPQPQDDSTPDFAAAGFAIEKNMKWPHRYIFSGEFCLIHAIRVEEAT
jgi:hypothetical protein